MSIVYIKFATREEEAEGVHELAMHTRVNGYRGNVYSVRREDLKWLEEAGIPYRDATDEEVEAARAAVRHITPALLQ